MKVNGWMESNMVEVSIQNVILSKRVFGIMVSELSGSKEEIMTQKNSIKVKMISNKKKRNRTPIKK